MSLEILYILLYLLIGSSLSAMSDRGHKLLYGKPMSWSLWWTGVFVWPLIFIIGDRKSK